MHIHFNGLTREKFAVLNFVKELTLQPTSNQEMHGIPLLKKEGAIKDSVIKLNYIFTISEKMIKKSLFSLSAEKRKIVVSELIKKLQ